MGSKRKSKTLYEASACTNNLATWMSELPEHVKERPLSELCIPGSHDSCTSTLIPGNQPGVDQPKIIRDLAARFPRAARYLLPRWSFTQHKDVEAQLHGGVRYFDIRCVSTGGNVIRVIHCLLGDNIINILTKVATFLQQHPRELVILDFQHLFNFSCTDHDYLIKSMQAIFGTMLCHSKPKDQMYSLKYLINSGIQVIVIYPIDAGTFCWTRDLCPNPWPNTTSTKYLTDFLTEKTGEREVKKTLFVSQAILTPRLSTIMLHPLSDLERVCSVPCNAAVLKWLQQNQHLKPNIVITDFVMNSNKSLDIISFLVKLNYM